MNKNYTKDRHFKVRDFRNKQFFIIDDAYLNGYARHLGPAASMVYISLCRHADKEQMAWPSQALIAKELGLNERTVMTKINLLKKWGLVRIEKTKNELGKWENNTYVLLDKSEWKPKPEEKEATYIKTTPGKATYIKPTSATYIKTVDKGNTTKKETQLQKKRARFSSLKDITPEDIQQIADRYKVPVGFVNLQLEKLTNYCESKGRRYRNYKAALRNFVVGDIQRTVERKGGQNDRRQVIDASNLG